MNKNKIIFSIIWVVIIWLIILWVSVLNSSSGQTNRDRLSTEDFKIWTYNLDTTKLEDILKEFKSSNSAYDKKNIVVENFSDYSDYEESLKSSIIQWNSPDIFLINNFEKSYIETQTIWINPLLINPNDFRKNYKTFLWDDLIWKIENWSWQTVEFVKWIPVWYETLWVFYNKKYWIKSTDLDSWAAVSNVVNTIKERNPEVIPLWIWNWSTVYDSKDIITQFFMLSWEDGIDNFAWISDVWFKEAFATYYSYADEKWNNWYDSKFEDMKVSWKTNLDLFNQWDLAMMIAYPSLVEKMDWKWFNKSFLFAEPFPHYFSSKWKTLVRYNYFVVNKNTKDETLAFDFLKYLSEEKWAKEFLNSFTYFLPALVSLEKEKLGEKINSSYNIVLGDFYKEWDDSLFSSFDKWITSLYDSEITNILDNTMSYIEEVKNFQKLIQCKYNKFYNLQNLSSNCAN